MINMIAAIADDNVIGIDNALPWSIPEDLRRFRHLTLSNTVIMGRKTFESIDMVPLPGRFNVVISNTLCPIANNEFDLKVAGSIKQAINYANAYNPNKEIFIIGGGDLYKACMGIADKLWITRVHLKCKVNSSASVSYFPEIDPKIWMQDNTDKVPKIQQSDVLSYAYEEYVKR